MADRTVVSFTAGRSPRRRADHLVAGAPAAAADRPPTRTMARRIDGMDPARCRRSNEWCHGGVGHSLAHHACSPDRQVMALLPPTTTPIVLVLDATPRRSA